MFEIEHHIPEAIESALSSDLEDYALSEAISTEIKAMNGAQSDDCWGGNTLQ